ncbi:uncharacterized protein M421DRAFT_28226, partial [Didymella exigua CBS 183.55]
IVLDRTCPAGTRTFRELLHRNHPVVAYARNPSKIPSDLSPNHLLIVIQGE